MYVENFISFENWVIEFKKRNPKESDIKELRKIYEEERNNFYSEQEAYLE